MKYKSFRIQNFKGIKDTTIEISGIAGANVFAFVGLNESGKTTVLEAIHSFSPDSATSELLGGEEGLGVPVRERVPRHLISEFTGEVSVAATVHVSKADKGSIAKRLQRDQNLILNLESIPDELVLERHQRFEDGDFKKSYFTLRSNVQVRNDNRKKWRVPTHDEKTAIRDIIYNLTPDIAYFPTFVFDFPESIFLTNRGSVKDKFYRRVFQDILDFDNRNHTIEKDVVRRVRREDMQLPWLSFWAAWSQSDDREKIQHVMDRAGAAVTRLVFGRWNKIFGEDVKGKEVNITFEVHEGEISNSQGAPIKTEEHDVSIKFQIRDGTRRFNVNDRSLGFRWFFSFMLFTQFRVARSNVFTRPLLFLFDEPASNLHAAAQQKLIESFPEIAKEENVLIYSTHSHYMIEPKWLEQTFIVKNRSDDQKNSILDEISLDDESLDIQVSTYRSFVNTYPGQTSYFQPILDRLEVVPSRFDLSKDSIILEGRSDYYIIRYAQKLLGEPDLSLLPGLGAGTFGALAALHVGWNLNFLFLLDADKKGLAERDRYAKEFGIPHDRLATIDQLINGAKVIEDIVDNEARAIIKNALKIKSDPNKAEIKRFFQEKLASSDLLPLGNGFGKSAATLIKNLKNKLQNK